MGLRKPKCGWFNEARNQQNQRARQPDMQRTRSDPLITIHTRISHRAWRQHWRSWSESKLKFCREYRNSSKLSFPSTTTSFPAPQQSLLPLRIQQSATPKIASRTFFDPTVSTTFNSKKSPQITTIGLSSRAETSSLLLPFIIFAKASSWYVISSRRII